MKPRHQIKFKRRVISKPRPKVSKPPNVKPNTEKETAIVSAQVAIAERQLRFARALSDTEKRVRDASLTSLQTWLSQNAAYMDTQQMDHLWKALFYCIWMADKPHIITRVIHNVVNLADIAGQPFLDALFVCIMREWHGIDRHRVDKYYELVTAALQKCLSRFNDIQSLDTLMERVEVFLNMLREKVWHPSRQRGIGLALHVLDVYIDAVMRPLLLELKRFKGWQRRVHKLYDLLLKDVFDLLGARDGRLQGLSRRARERIIDRLVVLVDDSELNLELRMKHDMVKRTSSRMFAIASDKQTLDTDRQQLYDSHINLKVFVRDCAAEDAEDSDDEDDAGSKA